MSHGRHPLCFVLNLADYEEIVRISRKNSHSFRIIAKGDFATDENSLWTVPAPIADYVKGNEIVFSGLHTRIEIFGGDIYAENEQRL